MAIPWSDSLPPNLSIAADKNPGKLLGGYVPDPGRTATADAMMASNSRNHAQKGQNVMMADVSVQFYPNPYCGFDRDNVWCRSTVLDCQYSSTGGSYDVSLFPDAAGSTTALALK